MIDALAIHGSQTKTTDASRGHSLTRCGDVKRQSSTYEHRQTSAARSSLSPRNLGGGFGSRRFLRLGWSASLREINELRRVGLSGADARAASFNLQVGHQLAVQAISAEAPRIHRPASFPDHQSHAPKPMDGEHGSVPGQAGELPLQRGERPDVGDC